MRRLLPILSFAAFCASLSGCWQGISRGVLATVLSVRGQAVWAMEGRNDFRPVTPQTKPDAGSILRTIGDAWVDLALLPGALIQISGSSELKIEKLRLTKDGNETEDGIRSRIVRVQLNRGKISALFQRRDESEMRFTIDTRHAMISADGDCLFQIQVEDAKTRVTCVRGKVYVSQANHQAVMEAGYIQEWPSDRSAAIAAADDARGQIDVSDTLEAERELQELQSKQRLRLPF
jgi:hypothetical protein